MTAPSNQRGVGELGRGVDALAQEVREMRAEITNRFDRQEAVFARKDAMEQAVRLLDVSREGLDYRISQLERANEDRIRDAQTNRRLAVTGILFPLVVGVLVAILVSMAGLP